MRGRAALMSEESVLLCSDRNGVRTLTLNRPRRKNAINRELWMGLAEALTAAGKDRDVRAVVGQVLASGLGWVSVATFEGRDVIRACITHGETTTRDVVLLVDVITSGGEGSRRHRPGR